MIIKVICLALYNLQIYTKFDNEQKKMTKNLPFFQQIGANEG